MPMVPVDQYGAGWIPETNKGRILVRSGNTPAVQLPIETPEEFIAILLLLSKTNVVFDTQTHELEIGMRPVGT